jgi:hypothetical protein
MTKKRKLSDLVAAETQRKEPNPQPTEPDSDIEPQPKYLSLVRKETRLKDLQIEQLTAISRKLNRQRRGRGERLTENTLTGLKRKYRVDKGIIHVGQAFHVRMDK